MGSISDSCSRSENNQSSGAGEAELHRRGWNYEWVEHKEGQWPIVYSPEYNISFLGLERLHPFDSGKWGNIFRILADEGMLNESNIVRPLPIDREQLLEVHTARYLDSLNWSANVARITEVPPVACLCNPLVQRSVLKPLRLQTSGTILAGRLAVDHGWAVNIGGGFHHCSGDHGGGFCVYADITLTIHYLFKYRSTKIKSAMIIDLDAHQGNGHERDFVKDSRVYILDVYNGSIYPHDREAKHGIRRNVVLRPYTEDEEYLKLISTHVEGSLNEFRPDVVVYNAGTDILDGDPLGALSISPAGIITRDETVFRLVTGRGIPLVMVTSGGYQRRTANIIAQSILNLRDKGLLKHNQESRVEQQQQQPQQSE